MAKKDKKRCSPSLIIREMQIKITMSYDLTLARMVSIKKSQTITAEEGVGKGNLPTLLAGKWIATAPMENRGLLRWLSGWRICLEWRRRRQTRVWLPSREDPPEKGMAIHSSILAWRIPRTENLMRYIPWGHTESDMTEATQHAWRTV